MKSCPSCGHVTYSDDEEFCIKCGAYYDQKRALTDPRTPPEPSESMDEGFQKMDEGGFSEALSRWTEALRNGGDVDDGTYGRILDECEGSILGSISTAGTHTRSGVADFALRLDDRDFITDLMARLSGAMPSMRDQRELMNLGNEYTYLALEAYGVYPDLSDMREISETASEGLRMMSEAALTKEPSDMQVPADRMLANYADFFALLAERIGAVIAKTPEDRLEQLSDYWASRSGAGLANMVFNAASMNVQLLAAGKLASKMVAKARDVQMNAFLSTYINAKV